MTVATQSLDQLAINTIRTLAIDGVQKANSGHPGAPMGAAPMAYTLWTRFLRHAPTHPDWPDRDRFILSAGHASILLYSMLFLPGYRLTPAALPALLPSGPPPPARPARGSRPSGPREVHRTTGVGRAARQWGRGVATGVGMGIAERWLRARFSP